MSTTLTTPRTGTRSYELMLALMNGLIDNHFQAELVVNTSGITLRTNASTYVVDAGRKALVAQSRRERTYSFSLTLR